MQRHNPAGERAALGEEWLRKAIATASLAPAMTRVTSAWPSVTRICESLAFVLTPWFPGEARPLLEECLMSMTSRFDLLLAEGQLDAGGDPAAFGTIIDALVAPTPRVMQCRAIAGAGSRREPPAVWLPGAEPLGEFWLRTGQQIEFLDEPHDYRVAPSLVRQCLSLSLLRFNEIEFWLRAAPRLGIAQ